MTSAESATIAEIVAGAESAAAAPAANRYSAVIAAQTVPPVPLRSSKRADMIGRNSIKPDIKNQVKKQEDFKSRSAGKRPGFFEQKNGGRAPLGPPRRTK